MKRLIAGGTGFIGHALIQHWQASDIQLVVLGRSKERIQQCYGDQVTAIDWHDFERQVATLLPECDVIINLCGANIGDKSWTAARRQQILASRVNTTTTLAKACALLGKKAPRLLNASAIGVYGLQDELEFNLPAAVDESSDISGEANDFLATVGRAWEQATAVAKQAEVNVVKMRFGVVLDKSGGALPRLALPFYFFVGGPIGSGHQVFSWISLHDLCRVMDFIIAHPNIRGAINCVSLRAVTQLELAHALGRALHRPSIVPTPAFALRCLLGERATELLLKGQHVVPTQLSDLGFHFEHPDIDTALGAIYAS